MYKTVARLFMIVLKVIRILFKTKDDLVTENLALRQQLAACKSKNINPKISDMDRSFWVALRRAWSNWADTLIIVKPETAIDWQRRRFKKYWWRKSSRNRRPGRRRIDQEIRDLIEQMARENYWGAPRIYSELLMLGYKNVKERTVILAHFPEESSGRHFSHGLLCGTNGEFRHSLRFLCYRSCKKKNCASECYGTSHGTMGQTAAERGISV
jgi:hypothetical protein